jgi:hypothetical protein
MNAVRSDRRQGMAGDRPNLVPIHQRVAARQAEIDPGAPSQRADDITLRCLGDFVRQVIFQTPVRFNFSGRARSVDDHGPVRGPKIDPVFGANDILDHIPPEVGSAIDQPRSDIDGERRAVLFEDRQRFREVVAIRIVRRNRCELFASMSRPNAIDRFVHGNKAIAATFHVCDHLIQKIRRNAQMPVDAEWLGRLVCYPVQHQNGANAANKRFRQRRKAGIPGHIQGHLPQDLAPVEHSFTFCG